MGMNEQEYSDAIAQACSINAENIAGVNEY
jgi:hypothetical protein